MTEASLKDEVKNLLVSRGLTLGEAYNIVFDLKLDIEKAIQTVKEEHKDELQNTADYAGCRERLLAQKFKK